MVKNGDKPIANPYLVLREEFDDWAVLFDPDTGRGFGLSPTGVYLWKLLDGEHSIDEMLGVVRRDCLGVPEEAKEHLFGFVEELAQHGLAAYEAEQVQDYRGRLLIRPAPASENVPGTIHFTYEPPRLVDLNSPQYARGDCGGGSAVSSCCACDANGSNNDGGYCMSCGTCARFCDTGYSANLSCMCGHNGGGQCNSGLNAGCWGACASGTYGDTCSTGNHYNTC